MIVVVAFVVVVVVSSISMQSFEDLDEKDGQPLKLQDKLMFFGNLIIYFFLE